MPTVVVSLNLPAGKYAVFGKTNPSSNGVATNCILSDGASTLDQGGVGTGGGGYSLDLSYEATVNLPGGGNVSIVCTGNQTAFSKLVALAVDAIN